MGILFVSVIRSGYLHAPLPARESTHKTQLDSLDGTGAKSTSIQQNATAFNNWQELPVDCWLFKFTKQKDTVRNFSQSRETSRRMPGGTNGDVTVTGKVQSIWPGPPPATSTESQEGGAEATAGSFTIYLLADRQM